LDISLVTGWIWTILDNWTWNLYKMSRINANFTFGILHEISLRIIVLFYIAK
jgi:hypothetical protein